MNKRRITKKIKVGDIYIGGDSPITVQSMVKVDARDAKAVLKQIHELEEVGCEIIRMNILDDAGLETFKIISKKSHIPVVADIHFEYRWAIQAMKYGVQKVRINPGNIGSESKVAKVIETAKKYKVPIRIGVNSGSIEKELLLKYKHPTAEAMVESASRHIEMLEKHNFDQIIVSLKASNVRLMTEANRLFSKKYDYPLHLGVTEAGPEKLGTIKSSVGIGSLLLDGIGDTIRVSLSGDPKEEIFVGKELLKAVGLRSGPTLISCPTCSRTQYNMIPLVKRVEKYLQKINDPIKVAIMGCIVNGPGEAKEADVGIAGGRNSGVLFIKGEVVKKVEEDQMYDELIKTIESIIKKSK